MLVGAAVTGVALLGVPSSVWAGGDPQDRPDVLGTISIAAQAAPATIGLGSGFRDTATLTPPAGGPAPTGTLSFSVYGPTDPDCTGPVLFNSANTLTGAATSSGAYTPPSTGTYRVIATYTGDPNYGDVATSCSDPADAVVVGLPPTLSAISSASGPTGGGNSVTITGTNLTGATTVNFGSVGTPATVNSPTQVVATAPAGSGPVNVTVTTPFGTTPVGSADLYSYAASVSSQPTSVPAGSGLPPVAATGPTTEITASSAKFSGIVDPDGLATTVQFEYTVRLHGGATVTRRTPVEPVGSDQAGHTVTATAAGLFAESRYRVRVVARSAAGLTLATATSFTTLSSPSARPPALGKTFDAAPVSGLVYVRLPGAGQAVEPLTADRQLPVGTTLDTRQGVARLSTATSSAGRDESASFAGGTFKLLQTHAGHGLAELEFVRASTSRAICAATAGQAAPETDLETLRASGTGRFEIRARDGSGTGTGATWTAVDRCDGLLASVARGVVEVDDFGRGQTATVGAGHTYLAKAG